MAAAVEKRIDIYPDKENRTIFSCLKNVSGFKIFETDDLNFTASSPIEFINNREQKENYQNMDVIRKQQKFIQNLRKLTHYLQE